MNSFKLNSFQRIITKNFATKARIQFLGKRSLLTNKNENQNQNEINYDNSFTINKYRLDISEEECEIVNNGGPINIRDWTKIKLKPKNKK